MKYDFDIVVIGGGAAGLFAVSVAIALGAKTCMIEKNKLGGDCTLFGCVPSKAILKSAKVANIFNRLSDFGLKLKNESDLDVTDVMAHVRGIIEEISTHHSPEVFEKRGIKVIFGSPRFLNKNTLEVNNKKIISKKFIICTGSHPLIPAIEGLKDVDYLTNENIFDLEELPGSLIVLGGGPIGLELAQSLHRLGVKVYVIEAMDRILSREDKEVSDFLMASLEKEGLGILTGDKVIKFEEKEGKHRVIFKGKDGHKGEISADSLLIAVGRAPNIDDLGLNQARVGYDEKGIKVNAYLQTSSENIFACGDVVGPYMFSHVAAYQASICVRNAIFRKIAWQKVNYQNIAWATFTDPEVSRLGLTESQAKEKYKEIKVYKNEYTSSDRAVTDVEREGFVKIITDKKGLILGAHIVGAKASEIIQGLLVAKSLKQPLSRIASVLFIYPTLSEIIRKTAAKPLVAKMDNPLVKFVMKILKAK